MCILKFRQNSWNTVCHPTAVFTDIISKPPQTMTDTAELNDIAIFHATVQQNSDLLKVILKWIQNNRTKKFNHRQNKSFTGNLTGPKTNHR